MTPPDALATVPGVRVRSGKNGTFRDPTSRGSSGEALDKKGFLDQQSNRELKLV